MAEAKDRIRPRLVAFDLDACSWETEMYLLDGQPFRRCDKTGKVFDRSQQEVALFPDMPKILHDLHSHDDWKGVEVAFVSRTHYPEWAEECLNLIHVNDRGVTAYDVSTHRQIYPGTKTTHFRKLQEATGLPFEHMLFFDNEYRNVRDVSTLGVTCVFTPEGMNAKYWQQGLDEHHDRHTKASARDT
eukprot:m.362526 g.362526  ORF g.362526 m.362526 type:complete len:187 (-) comp20602_c0_seq1:229-789(-)